MINGQSEQQNPIRKIKKAMKIHEIVSTDKQSLAECKNDLLQKRIAMDESEAHDIAESIREMFLPKLMKSEGIEDEEMPDGFVGEMTEDDDDFADEEDLEMGEDEEMDEDEDLDLDLEDDDFEDDDEEHEESEEDLEEDFDEDMDHEDDALDDEGEVDDDEIATIHIQVPANKIREIEEALESVLGEQSKDQAMSLNDKLEIGENNMNKKEIEARKALRKTILAAMADDEEVTHVLHKDGFEHAKDEQYREEGKYNTVKGNITDPETKTLNYANDKFPSFLKLKANLGLNETKYVDFDGTDPDAHEFKLAFSELDDLEIPSQGNESLYHELEIPSETELHQKRTVQSSTLGSFDADAAEEVLAFALKSAGVEEEDLGKLTYAEALELYKSIKVAKTAEDCAEDEDDDMHSDGKTHKKKAAEESDIRKHSPKEIDPEEDHMRDNTYSYSKESKDEYAAAIKKLMKGDDCDVEADTTITTDKPVTMGGKHDEAEMEKSAELYKARLKTAFAVASRLHTAGILPANEVEKHAEGLLNDGLTVNAMLRQTNIMLQSMSATAEKFASMASTKTTRTAGNGIAFNPQVRAASADFSGVSEIHSALRNLSWTQPKTDTGMED
jgi:hypothetical protein